MDSQYFEAVFQLRNPDDDVVRFIDEIMRSREKVFISRVSKRPNGADLYLSSNSFALSLGKKLHERFGGVLKISRRIHGRSRKTGKTQYRVTVFFECFGFKVGDAVRSGSRVIKITHCGKTISGIDLQSGKRADIDLRKDKPELLKPNKVLVIKTTPVLEVLHPETYQASSVENPKVNPKAIASKFVNVVVADEKLFLV